MRVDDVAGNIFQAPLMGTNLARPSRPKRNGLCRKKKYTVSTTMPPERPTSARESTSMTMAWGLGGRGLGGGGLGGSGGLGGGGRAGCGGVLGWGALRVNTLTLGGSAPVAQSTI